MKLTIDIPSALITLSAVGIAAVLAGAAPIQGPASDRDVQAVQFIAPDAPANRVTIREGTTFTVPTGKIFVAQGIGVADWSWIGTSAGAAVGTRLSADGAVIACAQFWNGYYGNGGMAQSPETLVEIHGQPAFAAGVTLEVSTVRSGGGFSIGTVFGYLADA